MASCRHYTERYKKHAALLDRQEGAGDNPVEEEFAVVQEVVPITSMGTVIALMKQKRKLEVVVVRH